MHIATLKEMNLPTITKIIEMFGDGVVPYAQIHGSDNFELNYWSDSTIR